MGRYENVLSEFHHLPICDQMELPGDFEGFYDNGVILIDKNLSKERKLEILAEELAHHHLTFGNIVRTDTILNLKFETTARRHAMENLITLNGLIKAFHHGCQNLYEIANFFEVTESFVQQCIVHYKNKHGLSTLYKGYLIQFEPLRVFEYKKLNKWGM